MRAYSEDLRHRVIAACEEGELSQRAVAERFGVSVPFVEKLLQRYRRTGEVAARKPGGRRAVIVGRALARLKRRLKEHPDSTLAELREACGVDCSLVTVHNTLMREGYRRKKNAARQ